MGSTDSNGIYFPDGTDYASFDTIVNQSMSSVSNALNKQTWRTPAGIHYVATEAALTTLRSQLVLQGYTPSASQRAYAVVGATGRLMRTNASGWEPALPLNEVSPGQEQVISVASSTGSATNSVGLCFYDVSAVSYDRVVTVSGTISGTSLTGSGYTLVITFNGSVAANNRLISATIPWSPNGIMGTGQSVSISHIIPSGESRRFYLWLERTTSSGTFNYAGNLNALVLDIKPRL